MSHRWYFTRDGRNRIGPLSAQELRDLAHSGQLLPTDMVWLEGTPMWLRACEVSGLFDASPDAADVSPEIPPQPAPEPSAPPVATLLTDCQRARRRYEWWKYLVTTWAACLAAWSLVAFVFLLLLLPTPDSMPSAGPGIAGVMLVALVGLVLWLIYLLTESRHGMETSCPACRTWWARRLAGSAEIDRHRAMTTVTRTDHFRGSAWVSGGPGKGSSYAPISGTTSRKEQVMVLRVTRRFYWRCVCCHHRWTTTRTTDHENFPLD